MIVLCINYIIDFEKVNSINISESTVNVEVMKHFFIILNEKVYIKY